jgi:hypothetical protein
MPRKRKYDNLPHGGRPAKDPLEKLTIVLRTKVTPPLGVVLAEDAKVHGFPEVDVMRNEELPVDYLRLCVYEHLRRVGIFEKHPELLNDPSWESLMKTGQV